nr:30S ribosomal protein S20 [Synergistales bacterium]
MANTRSARKRVRTSEKNRIYNRYWTTRCKTSAKKVLEAINSNDPELALKRF